MRQRGNAFHKYLLEPDRFGHHSARGRVHGFRASAMPQARGRSTMSSSPEIHLNIRERNRLAISFIGPEKKGAERYRRPLSSLRSKNHPISLHGFIPGPEGRSHQSASEPLQANDSEQLSILQALDLQAGNTGPIRGLPDLWPAPHSGQATATPAFRLG